MKRWKRGLRIGLPLLLVLGLAWNCMHDKRRNFETAMVTRVGGMYCAEFTGIRYLMVHDPISALMARTYEARFRLPLPRLEGVVEGPEIPRPRGWYKLRGTVAFDGGRMTVDLYYDNTDDGTRDRLSWNGEYGFTIADVPPAGTGAPGDSPGDSQGADDPCVQTEAPDPPFEEPAFSNRAFFDPGARPQPRSAGAA